MMVALHPITVEISCLFLESMVLTSFMNGLGTSAIAMDAKCSPSIIRKTRLEKTAPLNKKTSFILAAMSRIVSMETFSQDEKHELLRLHNLYRSNISPPAGNMNFMVWDDELADLAQAWSNNCQFRHGFPPNLIPQPIGQNLYRGWESSGTRAMYLWYAERQHYDILERTCEPLKKCGHYTQIIWAESNRVGCAKQRCAHNKYLVVCHYLPAGNVVNMAPYLIAKPCSQCGTDDGGLCANNLCVTSRTCQLNSKICGVAKCDLRCENCGKLDAKSCRCLCPYGWDSLDCSNACKNAHENCGRSPGWPSLSSCSKNHFAVSEKYCREMCGKCRQVEERTWLNDTTCCAGTICPPGHVLDLERHLCSCRLQCPAPGCYADMKGRSERKFPLLYMIIISAVLSLLFNF